jgi:8-hydroxy-5-deazaflavin:NADPH oxidoreductase
MKIGILGAGPIGSTIATRLSAAGHQVSIANSRGPETIARDIVEAGVRPVDVSDVADGADVVIVSIPLNAVPGIAHFVRQAPAGAVIIDTSNYYPRRDQRIADLEEGKPESVWTSEHYGRPVAKAWNAITAESFKAKAAKAGEPDRVAIPVAADSDADRAVAMALVEETGFDAFDAGVLADSWRQQPGSPAYCTDRTLTDIAGWLAAADKQRSPQRRDLAMATVYDFAEAGGIRDSNFMVSICRACYI